MYFIFGLFGTFATMTGEVTPKLLQTAFRVSFVAVAVNAI